MGEGGLFKVKTCEVATSRERTWPSGEMEIGVEHSTSNKGCSSYEKKCNAKAKEELACLPFYGWYTDRCIEPIVLWQPRPIGSSNRHRSTCRDGKNVRRNPRSMCQKQVVGRMAEEEEELRM